ncbi:sulfatase-like hydrolase/transferase [Ramlibacter sp. AW1]|uniref:Sulfatase-like hydrolase/transferase n=1 Tax=Ramlibacter aurantiacus TaxID=2801330 RepID=A0A936ZID5_9BURK|nr:sulfatase-like hydrolase/transferase [Ramlibacter aurantiacus]MBL0421467.1 sulfatase-like hydrolase/transferase [Ramlibacter aurantiacus]
MDRRPNFIFILADDLGYADLGCFGARDGASTPHLDRLAAGGVRFTDGYANSALCSPSRFALITGRYQYRLRGAAEEPLPPSAKGQAHLGLPPSHPTLPSLLRDAGYDTALVGKWHLGYPPHFGPLKSGYDEFFGTLGGGIDYFSHIDHTGTRDLHDGEVACHERGYVTDLLTRRAVDYVSRRHDRPFLLSLHYTAPHWPWEARDDEAESARIGRALLHYDGGSPATYRRMVSHMDEGIGKLLASLQRHGLDQNTFIVFTSDNGGERFSDVWPFVGAKMDLLEGGIRVPLIARWPAGMAAGASTPQVAATMDWMPTFLSAAGVVPDPEFPPDGIDLMPVLREPGRVLERALHWRMKHRGQRALRLGDWKYLVQDGHEYLFNLAADPRERANLARRSPGILADMRRQFDEWEQRMPSIPPDAYVGRTATGEDMARPG